MSSSEFRAAEPDTVIGSLTRHSDFAVLPSQRDAWLRELIELKWALEDLEGGLLLEFSIPRVGRRIDAVLIIGAAVLVATEADTVEPGAVEVDSDGVYRPAAVGSAQLRAVIHLALRSVSGNPIAPGAWAKAQRLKPHAIDIRVDVDPVQWCWCNIASAQNRNHLRNACRVLLTRARQGMVIFVPPGDRSDLSRPPEYSDSTFQYLSDVGIPVIGG